MDHPRPWELFVQARIRVYRPPCQPPDFALVGRDSEGIGAFVAWQEVDGPRAVQILGAAVAQRFRGKGGGWADEMMRTLFDTLTLRALDERIDAVAVTTWVHEFNHPSQRLCRNFGMAHTGACIATDPAMQEWATLLLVGGAQSGIDPF